MPDPIVTPPPAPVVPPPAAVLTTPPPAPKLGGNGADTVGGAGDDAPKPWGDDWRAGLSRGDDARLKRLERYATPDAVADALFSAQDRIRAGGRAPALADDATPEEIAAYRKLVGIPDKADGYGLAFPESLKPSEADTAGLAAFQEYMHAKHIPPAAAKAAFDFYTQSSEAGRAKAAEAAQEINLQNVAELRKEYPGREFKRNMTIAEEFLGRHFEGSEEALDAVLGATLPSGVTIKNYAPFIKGLVAMARSYADDEALIGGDGGGGGKSMDDEYKELVAKSAVPGARLTVDENKRLAQLAEARQARLEKQGGRKQAA
jgi:hypothetical protein